MYENRRSHLPRMRDDQRFTLAELLEIYGRISVQRRFKNALPRPDPLPMQVSYTPLVPSQEHPYFIQLRKNAIRMMIALSAKISPVKRGTLNCMPQTQISTVLPIDRLSNKKRTAFLGKRNFSSGKGTCGENDLGRWHVGAVIVEGWGQEGGFIKDLIRKREEKWLKKQITDGRCRSTTEVASVKEVEDLSRVVFGKEVKAVEKEVKEETVTVQ